MKRRSILLGSFTALMLPTAWLVACPFCVSEMQTLSEELADADLAVIARMIGPATSTPGDPADAPNTAGARADQPPVVDPDSGKATFVIEHVLKGGEQLEAGAEIQAIYYGRVDFEKRFLIRGITDPTEWMIPIQLSPLAVDYVQQLQTLTESGADRLEFFQPYLEHEDRQLAQDAYDEFARAPYDDLIALGDRIDYDRVVKLINEPQISPSRRRLFLVMLGVRGSEADLPMLEAFLEPDVAALGPATVAASEIALAAGGPLSVALSVEAVLADERRKKLGLDAMIACYLTLAGDRGLDLVDRRFLGNPDADQTHLYRVLMALRFIADEQQRAAEDPDSLAPQTVSRDRLLASARLLLHNRDFADQVIIDLARWDDWTVVEKLGEMFRRAGEVPPGEEEAPITKWVRVPIVTYLDIAAEQDGPTGEIADELLAELEPIDPELFARARRLHSFGILGRARAAGGDTADEQAASGEVIASDEPAGLADSASAFADDEDDMPPNPADFASSYPEEFSDGEPEAAPEPEQQAATPQPEPDQTPQGPAGAEPLTPPSRFTLVALPVGAVVICFGLFWLILRGGI